jgi:hypothetical protein
MVIKTYNCPVELSLEPTLECSHTNVSLFLIISGLTTLGTLKNEVAHDHGKTRLCRVPELWPCVRNLCRFMYLLV